MMMFEAGRMYPDQGRGERYLTRGLSLALVCANDWNVRQRIRAVNPVINRVCPAFISHPLLVNFLTCHVDFDQVDRFLTRDRAKRFCRFLKQIFPSRNGEFESVESYIIESKSLYINTQRERLK
jgi:hypothetical protein